MSSKVSASSVSSSRGPCSASRSCRLDEDSRRAVAVIVFSGRSARPDSHQPAATATATATATTVTAISDNAETISSVSRVIAPRLSANRPVL